jgi:hypothetical protein
MPRKTEDSHSNGPALIRSIRNHSADRAALVRGSPEWSALVAELLRRDSLDDVDELCRLMGIEEFPLLSRFTQAE